MIAQLQEDVVQGPVEHATLGKTVFVHPTLPMARAGKFPSQAVVVTAAARRLIGLAKDGERVHAVVVEGEGERDPTTHPEFHEISQNLRELMNKHFPKGALCLNSEMPELSRPQARHALSFYDQPNLRLDAGTQKTFAALTGEAGKIFKDIVENMGRLELERLIISACFVRGSVDNSKDAEVKAWLRHLADIKPATVRITTLDKADKDKDLKPITKTRMTQIADLIVEKTGITVERQED